MHLFIEIGMLDGISMTCKSYVKTNNPHIKYYDPFKANSHIMYSDENNLYGWSISQPLPTWIFKRIKDCKGFELAIASNLEDSKKASSSSLTWNFSKCIPTGTGAHGCPEKVDI